MTHHFETLAIPPDGSPGHLLVVDLGHGLQHNHDNMICISLFLHSTDIYYQQYCQVRNINILTRLSRSKHTLVNILTIGQVERP